MPDARSLAKLNSDIYDSPSMDRSEWQRVRLDQASQAMTLAEEVSLSTYGDADTFVEQYGSRFGTPDEARDFFENELCSDGAADRLGDYIQVYRSQTAEAFSDANPDHAFFEKADKCFGVSQLYGYESTDQVRSALSVADNLNLPQQFDCDNTLNAMQESYDLSEVSGVRGQLASALVSYDQQCSVGHEFSSDELSLDEISDMSSEYAESDGLSFPKSGGKKTGSKSRGKQASSKDAAGAEPSFEAEDFSDALYESLLEQTERLQKQTEQYIQMLRTQMLRDQALRDGAAFVRKFEAYFAAAEYAAAYYDQYVSQSGFTDKVCEFTSGLRDRPYDQFDSMDPDYSAMEQADAMFGCSKAVGYDSCQDIKSALEVSENLGLTEFYGESGKGTLNHLSNYDLRDVQAAEEAGLPAPDYESSKLLQSCDLARWDGQELDVDDAQAYQGLVDDVDSAKLEMGLEVGDPYPTQRHPDMRKSYDAVQNMKLEHSAYENVAEFAEPMAEAIEPSEPVFGSAPEPEPASGCAFDLRDVGGDVPNSPGCAYDISDLGGGPAVESKSAFDLRGLEMDTNPADGPDMNFAL